MRTIGSQIRATLKEAGLILVEIDRENKTAILYDSETEKEELWSEQDDFAGFTVEINGVGYEFVRDI